MVDERQPVNTGDNLIKPQRLRHVVIGAGALVFNMHRPGLQLASVDLLGVTDIDRERGQQRARELGCPFYADYPTMLAETQPDVAVIMTPHPWHAPITLDCLQAGCHVLVEKPMAIHVREADAMIEAATQAGRLLAVNFQHRHRPEIRTAHRLIQQGFLGTIQYVTMTATLTRTARYYKMSSWRGTWNGEGGGVLMNQAPHYLDLLCYLLGMPSRVVAWTRTQLHQIETEDTVQAMLQWPGGAWGALHLSTAEAGQPERLEIVGTGGCLQISRDTLNVQQFALDLRTFITQSNEPFSAPVLQQVPVEIDRGSGDHTAVYRNLHEAICHHVPLVTDGVAGRMSLELANATIYSSYTREEVSLPLDRQKYVALLEDLKAQRFMAAGH